MENVYLLTSAEGLTTQQAPQETRPILQGIPLQTHQKTLSAYSNIFSTWNDTE